MTPACTLVLKRKYSKKMDPVVFLSTSPTFMLVKNGLIPELSGHGLIQYEGQKTVEINRLCGSDVQSPYTFGSLFDFSRTAGSVLRMFMLEASGMNKYFNAMFRSKAQNFDNCVRTPPEPQFCMAYGDDKLADRRAKLLASEFDRLFPHFSIEYALDLISAGGTKTVSGHMYVIYFDEKIIFQIDATMDVNILNLPSSGKEIHANVHVGVLKYVFTPPIITPENPPEYSRYALVKQLVDEWKPSQIPTPEPEVEALMQNLSI